MNTFPELLPRAGRRAAAATVAAVALAGLLLAACDDDNLYRDSLTGPGTGEAVDPAVLADTVAPSQSTIVLPLAEATAAIGDPLQVRVSAADAVGLDSVVAEGFTSSGNSRTIRFERAVRRYAVGDTVLADTVAFLLQPVGIDPSDAVRAVATSYDRAGNFRADTLQISLAEIRGTVIPLENNVDRIVDLVSDGSRLFLSNFSRNRVEVIDLGTDQRSSFRVGSQPWGLALSPDSSTLYVANSGGTNISVVDLRQPLREDELRRIQTPNVQLFQVPFSRDSIEVVDSAGRRQKISVQIPGNVTSYDYSDRPQFIAQTASGQILYSTKPTGTAGAGTIRRLRTDGEVEFFLEYARKDQSSQLVVVNADSAELVEGDPNLLFVQSKEGNQYLGVIDSVRVQLQRDGSETYFDYFRNLEDVALRDTTFVAVSGDRRTVAFGEGDNNPGRIILFNEVSGDVLANLGNTRDLVNNAAERVIGLALNRDGTLGAARGQEAYFFDPDLRLQGVGLTGAPTGGISFQPSHADYPLTPSSDRLAFVSGRDENGSSYVDVMDTFSFFRRKRIFTREAITGPLIVVSQAPGSTAAMRVYGITAAGVLRVDVNPADLAP